MAYFPPLLDPQRFQLLARDLLQEKLKIPLQIYGRLGQSQHGIDLYGLIPHDTALWNTDLRRLVQDKNLARKYIVIQCKSRLEGPLTYETIKDDYEKTCGLEFEVGIFIVVTSAKRDTNLQDKLAVKHLEMPKFKAILFWPDLVSLLELNPKIAGEFYGTTYSEKSQAILGIKNTLKGLPAEEAIQKAEPLIVELVDNTIRSNGILAYRNIVTYLIDCLSTAIAIIPKKQVRTEKEDLFKVDEGERKRRYLLGNIDLIFREAFIRLLKKSFDDHEWKKGSEILKGIAFCLEELKTVENEAIFSNWIGDLRAFYKELEVELANLTRVSYDEGLYSFVITFSELLSIPIQKALEIQAGLFTLGFGLDVVTMIVREQIDKPRRFYTSEDDFSFPTSISIMIEPLMRGINTITKLLSDFRVEPKDFRLVEARWEELANLLFLVLKRYRELNSETDIDRSMLGSILSRPEIIRSHIFSSNLEDFLNFPEPRRFDYIIRPITVSLRRNREFFDDVCLTSLFKASLASYRIQRPLYGRIRNELRELCIECIESVSDDNKPKMILALAEELISPPEKNDDDSVVYGFQLLGRLITESRETKALLELFRKKIDSLEGIKPPSFLVQGRTKCRTLVQYVYERNKEIANWRLIEEEEESELFKPWRPVYEEWEVNGSKKVVELFDQNPALSK